MSQEKKYWQIPVPDRLPHSFIECVKNYAPKSSGKYLAQLLWQRGIKDTKDIVGFLDPKQYQPTSSFEFDREINKAIERIIFARNHQEKVAIWGDFDADGITSTSVLWDGLGEFFDKNTQLTYYIPNRFTESHGLNFAGIERLAKANYSLIITCDTGSTNIAEIEYANNLGIDIIVTDHHTLPTERPPLFAIINPRYFPQTHPLYNLSGVGVAYKLIEALYLTYPEIPKLPLTELLDLVAIGLIADLVQLTDDCRYLAQIGIEKLSTQLNNTTRPGVAKLLELCKKTGDRPTDISFGIGPRINAVSRIMGDASFCVELLTSRDPQHCQKLALETELANSRRKSLQKEVAEDVAQKLTKLDLSTTHVIVLTDPQWSVGVLGLVAGQIAQEYGRPTILLSEETDATRTSGEKLLARGSARSFGTIDLYELVKNQAHLLDRFGGHPFAAGLSLAVENIPIFTDAINQLLGQTLGVSLSQTSVIEVDLILTVSELGRDLFQELKLLEPCGMGNPVPKLLIQGCWFTNVWHRNQTDLRGNKVKYIKTSFEICDESIDKGFPGIWWGHYKDEIPSGICDAVVELDFNTYEKRYEVRLIAVQPTFQDTQVIALNSVDWILDWRGRIQNSKVKSQKYFLTDESQLSFPANGNSKFDTQNYSSTDKSQVLPSGSEKSKVLPPENGNLKSDTQNYCAIERSQVLPLANGNSKFDTQNYSSTDKSQVLPPEIEDVKFSTQNYSAIEKSQSFLAENQNLKFNTFNYSPVDKSQGLPPGRENLKLPGENYSAIEKSPSSLAENQNLKFNTSNYSSTDKSQVLPPEIEDVKFPTKNYSAIEKSQSSLAENQNLKFNTSNYTSTDSSQGLPPGRENLKLPRENYSAIEKSPSSLGENENLKFNTPNYSLPDQSQISPEENEKGKFLTQNYNVIEKSHSSFLGNEDSKFPNQEYSPADKSQVLSPEREDSKSPTQNYNVIEKSPSSLGENGNSKFDISNDTAADQSQISPEENKKGKFSTQNYNAIEKSHSSFLGNENLKFNTPNYTPADQSDVLPPRKENLKLPRENYSAIEKSPSSLGENENLKFNTPNYTPADQSQISPEENKKGKFSTQNYSAIEKSQSSPSGNQNSKLNISNYSLTDKSQVLRPGRENAKFQTKNYSAIEKSQSSLAENQNFKFNTSNYSLPDQSQISPEENEKGKFSTKNYSAIEKSQSSPSGNGNSKFNTSNYSLTDKSQVLPPEIEDVKFSTQNYSAIEKSQVLPPENQNFKFNTQNYCAIEKSQVLPPENQNFKFNTQNYCAIEKLQVLPPENGNSKFDTQNYCAIEKSQVLPSENEKDLIILTQCPTSWNDLRIWFRRAINQQKKLAIAYSQRPIVPPVEIWQKLLGIAKYLSRTGQPVTRYQLLKKLSISDATLKLGFKAIQYFGFNVKYKDRSFYIIQNQTKNKKASRVGTSLTETLSPIVEKFLAAVSEEQFRQKYFCEVPLKTIEAIAAQTILEDTNTSIPF